MAEESENIIVMQVPPIEMISINTICRLCANQSDKLIRIYGEDGISNDLSIRINTYLPIKVSENDQLPLQCCWQCASTIVTWHNLVETTIEADRKLKECQFITEKVLEAEEEYPTPTPEIKLTTEDQQVENCQELVQTSLNSFCQSETVNNDASSEHDENDRNDDDVFEENIETSLTPYINLDSYNSPSNPDNGFLKTTLEEQTNVCGNAKEDVRESEEEMTLYNFECEYCHMIFVTEIDIMTHLKKAHGDEIDFDLEDEDPKPKQDVADVKEEEITEVKYSEIKQKRKKPKISKLDQEVLDAAKFIVDNKEYYKCDDCNKTLHSPYTFKSHIRIHTGERPFTCHLCGKSFRVSQGLMRHIRETHERIKIYPCDVCGRMFTTKRNVDEHRNIHTDDRPYTCMTCGKSFRQKASLFVHKRTHTDHFPFKCQYCGHGFRTVQSLNVHTSRHTGERPFPCEHCGRRFRIKYELKRHTLIHSDVKPYTCGICNVSFRQKRYLKNHNRANHQELAAAT